MKIQVLGSGCPTCKKLFEQTKQVVKDLGLDVEVEYITDIQKIVEMGMMTSPILAVNGKPVLAGLPGDLEKISDVIKNSFESNGSESDKCCNGKGNCDCEPEENKNSGCSCGGNC
ncbi:MAG: MTH895/ArsE family thioredoxin-like protein [Patescibacteria group bacterium]|jgi:small redox-active disulfide protein 2